MATGAGKTRMAAALVKRLFDAHWITRALFLVDRTTLAKQTEDAFAEHLPTLATYRVPRTGERFRPEKQITICTLQTMINEYRAYSSGYFDLIVIDECHRGIYGEYRRVLDHFDAVKLGLTATPLVGRLPEDADPMMRVRPRHAALLRGDRADLPLHAQGGHRRGLSRSLPHLPRPTVKTAASGGFEVRREEIDWAALDVAREALEEAFGDQAAITVDPRRSSAPSRSPSATGPWSASSGRSWRKAIPGADGVRRAPPGQDDRLRRHKAARRDACPDVRRRLRR